MSRAPAYLQEEAEIDEASHSSVRTVNGESRRSQQQQQAQFEPLLAADALGQQSMRHVQRQATQAPVSSLLAPSLAASAVGASSASPNGLSDPLEFGDVSYAIDNSNYEVNQRHRQQLSLDGDLSMTGAADADARYIPAEDDYGSGIASSSDYARFAGLAELPNSDSSIAFHSADPHGNGHIVGLNGGSSGRHSSFEFMVSPQRWWVLFVFCFLSFNQSMIWLTFSPITKKTEAYYSISESQTDLLLNFGPIIYLPLLIPIARMGSTSRGVRLMVVATAFSGLLCCIIRLIPEYLDKSSLHPHAIWFLNAGHIINAASGPPLMATITKLSCIWFSAEERTTSTAILFMATNFGGMVGFLVAPAIVQTPQDIPKFLWFHLGATALAFLCTFPFLPRWFFPEKPERFPSEAAAQMQAQSDARVAGTASAVNDSSSLMVPSISFNSALAVAVKNRSFVLLSISNGALQGIVFSWTSILTTVLPDSFDDTTCGWFSFASSLATVAAGIAVGASARHPSLRRRLKALVVGGTILSTVFSALFLALTPSVIDPSRPLLASSVLSMGVAITLLGAFVGATCPLAFELVVELTYPAVPESVSASAISGMNNLGALVFLFLAPHERYLRLDGEATAALVKQQQQRSTRFHSDAYLDNDASSEYGGSQYSGSVPRRSVLQAAHEDDMQKEFARVMREVDEGMQPHSDQF